MFGRPQVFDPAPIKGRSLRDVRAEALAEDGRVPDPLRHGPPQLEVEVLHVLHEVVNVRGPR
eukprot:3340477-Alexandrium_andersonii.AAC.1